MRYLLCLVLVAACNKAPAEDPAQYYLQVDEVAANLERVFDHVVRVHGFVAAGSITEGGFLIEQHGVQLAVRYDGPRPDQMRDRAEVVAKGRLRKAGGALVLEADEVLSKCPSRYQGQTGSAF
jgi:cytochrome c-type biogenesis protein CcmE